MMFDLPLPFLADAGVPPPPIVPLKAETFSGQSSLDVSFDLWEFEHVLCLIDQWQPSSDAIPYLRTSSDGGSTFDAGASDYRYNAIQHNPATTTGGATGLQAQLQLGITGSGSVDAGVGLACFLARIWRPYDTSDRTYVHMFGGWDHNMVADAMTAVGSGYRDAVGKVDAIRFLPSAGTMSGRIAAWGLLI